MSDKQQARLNDFACYLLTQGFLDQKNIDIAYHDAIVKKISFITYLGQYEVVQDPQLAKIIANYFGLPYFDLDHYNLNNFPKDILAPEWILKFLILPLFNENKLTLGVADPSVLNLNEIHFLTGLPCTFVIVETNKLTKILDSIFRYQDNYLIKDKELLLCLEKNLPEEKSIELFKLKSESHPVVKFLNQLLIHAIEKNASDIHFEPYEDFYRIRFRIDGLLHEMKKLPQNLANYLTSRLKVMANLDISQHKMPQDGRFKFDLTTKSQINFRINICPTLHGEKTVLRCLKSADKLLDLNTLGLTEPQKLLFSNALQRAQGMILVTGPTGSGKTMTLYTALNILNTIAVNICAVEDPIEIQVPGINQVQVHSKTGLTFANTLRAFLRQDPDIIMVGEMRDLETAEIAVKAAQTGHLVLSTVHTNSAIETLLRLSNLGISSFNIVSSILLIIAQRLVRRLCERCKQAVIFSDKILLREGFLQEELSHLTIYEPRACKYCTKGYKGRIGIYEVLPISREMMNLILESAHSTQLSKQAFKENLQTLRKNGLEKVREGITSLEELNRVISP